MNKLTKDEMNETARTLLEVQRFLEEQGLFRYANTTNKAAQFLLREDVQTACNPEPQPEADGWFWARGIRPVDRDVQVDVRFRNGQEFLNNPACTWQWGFNSEDDNIVAWRLAKGA